MNYTFSVELLNFVTIERLFICHSLIMDLVFTRFEFILQNCGKVLNTKFDSLLLSFVSRYTRFLVIDKVVHWIKYLDW